MITKTLKVEGMHCPSCALRIEGELEDMGVTARANYQQGTVTISIDGTRVSDEQVALTISRLGYRVMSVVKK